MTSDAALFAYAVTTRPSRAPGYLRVGAAFPRRNGPGLTVILNALPLRGRIVLLEPPAPRSNASFFPACMPADLATRAALRGESLVWHALRRAPLPPGTRVFYNRSPQGCRRRADFLILHPERGIIALEVKGGRVHYHDGFRQQLAGGLRWQKRIQPWGQAQRAIGQIITALKINPLLVPHAAMVALPGTFADALPFPPAPHLLTAEDLTPADLARKLEALLPRLDPAASEALAPALDRITQALTPPPDERPT
jgi:hypothetical protein